MKVWFRNHVSHHRSGTTLPAYCARWYLEHYDNHDLDHRTNGEADALRRVSGNLSTIVDVGASIGEWSTLAKQLNPCAKVWSIEPSVSAFHLLKQRVGIEPSAVAISDYNGTAKLYVEPTYYIGSLYEHDRNASCNYSVPIYTLQTWMEHHCLTYIDYLKIDTEGSDLRVLSKAPLNMIRYIQFEHIPEIATYARVWLRDFYDLLTPTHHIARITKQGLDWSLYNSKMETIRYANYFCSHNGEIK